MRALSFAFGLLMAVIATTGHAQQGPTSSPVKPKEICHVGGCCQDDPGTQEICYFSQDGTCNDCRCESSRTCGGDGDVLKHPSIPLKTRFD
jgi:hypothetical protein